VTELVVSIGGAHPAHVTRTARLSWEKFAEELTRDPPVTTDKAARGWYCPVEFNPPYRDSDNFVARHAITFDFDHVDSTTWPEIATAWGGLSFAQYTTFSHTPEKPRFRVVLPLSRGVTYDEYQAISRKLAADIGIELVARESFVPCQMMYLPTKKADVAFESLVNVGETLNPDDVLAEYEDWTDRSKWPRRAEGDSVHSSEDVGESPLDKPGIIGEFNRVFSIEEAIERFELPYDRVR